MTEKIGLVKNPLTIVGIFAGIAEVSGSAVLPFIKPENQQLYIWFLMLFPTYLVTLFFLVLLFKHRVLYAPSDFKDDRSFIDLVRPTSPSEQLEQMNLGIMEAVANSIEAKTLKSQTLVFPRSGETEPGKGVSVGDLRARYIAAEQLAVAVISRDLNMSFGRQVRLTPERGGGGLVFDAGVVQSGKLYAIEVKYLQSAQTATLVIEKYLEKVDAFLSDLPGEAEILRLIVAVVVDDDSEEVRETVQRSLRESCKYYRFVWQVRVYGYNELQRASEAA